MLVIGVVVLCGAVSSVYGGWLDAIAHPHGLDIGSGITLHLDRPKSENATIFDRSLRVDFGGMGMSVGKALKKEALQVGLYNQVEGRKKNVGEIIFPLLLGVKTTGVVALVMSAVGTFVVKALMVAKIAALVSLAVVLLHLLHHKDSTPHVEEYYHPMEYHASATGYSPSGTANYLSYSYATPYQHTGVETAESVGQYAIVEAPNGVHSSTPATTATKRRDFHRKKFASEPLISVKKLVIEH